MSFKIRNFQLSVFSFLTILLSMIVFFSATEVSAQTPDYTLQMCVGHYCNNYNGSDSPLYSTDNADYDQARWQAYRYEFDHRYQQAVSNLQNQANQWAEQKKNAEHLSPEQYEKVKVEALENLHKSIPPIPPSLPTWQEKRQLNPYPSASARLDLDKKLDLVWENIATASPKKIANAVNTAMSSLVPPEDASASVTKEMSKRREFLQKELAFSQVTDSQGLLNFPLVDKSNIILKTSGASSTGNQLRGDLNRNYANTSSINAMCAAKNLPECADLKDFNASMETALYTMDRWASQARDLSPGSDFAYVLKSLEVEIAFAEGAAEGGVEMIKGLVQIVRHPIDTANAIGSAVMNYDKTAIALSQAVSEHWDAFKAGTPTERSKIIGRVSFEVAAAFVPVSKLGVVGKVVETSTAFEWAVSKTGEVLNIALKGGAQSATEARIITEAVGDLVRAGRPIVEAQQDLGKLTPLAVKSYTEAITEMGSVLTPGAQSYLTKQATYAENLVGREFSKTELITSAEQYMQIEKKMEGIAGVGVDEVVWRGVNKELNIPTENIIQSHPKALMANGRYSAPGETAVYTTLGEEVSAKATISKELDLNLDKISFAQKKVTYQNVLDLTDTGTLKKLGINPNDIIDTRYALTHQLGATAKSIGFDAIKAPNRFQTYTLIIFKGLP
jgi:hypothetical protein